MKRPVVAFRTNGSAIIGLGHLRRCMTLAQELQAREAETRFVVNEEPGLLKFLREHGFEVAGVGEGDASDLSQTLKHLHQWAARTLVVDSYEVPGECLSQVRDLAVVVIDDLADRSLPVDLVINGAANACDLAYRTSPRTRLLLGPEYVLLRKEFAQAPTRSINANVRRVLITVGGMDPHVLTPRLIAWTQEALGGVAIDVVVGPFFGEDSVAQTERMTAGNPPVALHRDPATIRNLMLACDLALTGGGQTAYELAATGTPAVAIRMADNQTGNLKGLSTRGALRWIGDVRDGDLHTKVLKALGAVSVDQGGRQAISESGRELVDGRGAGRVAQAIMESCGKCP